MPSAPIPLRVDQEDSEVKEVQVVSVVLEGVVVEVAGAPRVITVIMRELAEMVVLAAQVVAVATVVTGEEAITAASGAGHTVVLYMSHAGRLP